MTFKYQRGTKVSVSLRNGKSIKGTVKDAHVNFCTFRDEYDIDYKDGGKSLTLICVPERAISIV